MKSNNNSFFKENLAALIMALAFVLVFAFGIVFNSISKTNQANRKEIRPYTVAYPEATEIVADDSFREKTVEGVKLTEKRIAYINKDEVGYIYVGHTKGWKDNLTVAFGIDKTTHQIVGMSVISSNETPMFIDLLLKGTNFLKQFSGKKLSDDDFKVDLIAGTTPMNGNHGTIAPATSAGIEKIMIAVRKQYEADSGGKFKIPDLIKISSKKQNFANLDQLIYVFEYKEEDQIHEINVIFNLDYEIVEIKEEEFNTDKVKTMILNAVKPKNAKINEFITGAEFTEDKIIISTVAAGFGGNITSTLEFNKEYVLVKMDTVGKDETPGFGDEAIKEVVPNIVDNNTWEVDGYAGATYTSDGVKASAKLAYQYIEYLKGGNLNG